MGDSPIRGALLGVPIIRVVVFCSSLGPAILGTYVILCGDTLASNGSVRNYAILLGLTLDPASHHPAKRKEPGPSSGAIPKGKFVAM